MAYTVYVEQMMNDDATESPVQVIFHFWLFNLSAAELCGRDSENKTNLD